MSSSRAIATSSVPPPQSSTRVNSHTRPSETAKVERSRPIATTTTAASAGPSSPRARLGERAQEREGLEVDPDEPDAGLLAGGDVAVDQLAVGDDEQDAHDRAPVLVDALAQHVVVEHGLLDRDRQDLLRAEPDRVLELARVLDPGDLEDRGRRCGCWRCRGERPGGAGCACGRTRGASRRAARARAALRRPRAAGRGPRARPARARGRRC